MEIVIQKRACEPLNKLHKLTKRAQSSLSSAGPFGSLVIFDLKVLNKLPG